MNSAQKTESAVTFFRAGDFRRAKEICEAILADKPRHTQARHLLAVIAFELGKPDEGISHFETLAAISPDHPGVHADLAKALASAGRIDEAIAAFRVALSIVPEDVSLLNNLGSLLAGQGELSEAVSSFEAAVEANDRLPVSHYNLAKALRDSGDPQRAIQHYKRTLELDPGFATAWRNLGNLYLDVGEVDLAAEAYEKGVRIKWSPEAKKPPDQSHLKTSRSKLQHDIEQLAFLLENGKVDRKFEQVLSDYRAVLDDLPVMEDGGSLVAVSAENQKRLAPYFNRLIHWPQSPSLAGPAVNPDLDRAEIETAYFKNAPGIVHVDDFLSPAALQEIRQFCLESTIWYRHHYKMGYVGAFMEDGFVSPLLLQIADELRNGFPRIFGAATLRKLWGFKYDSRLSGIPVHADFAAVNVNFWVTPDAANRDPQSGGLVVWDKEAPLDWDFATYNADEQAMRRFLTESGAKAHNIPYRENRMVMFNSDLIHETGELNFEEGYENRRVNVTMLYGKRENAG
ncbi:tetratricopeptide repeat protein [Denitrobaculum tricleocarpae]|nr:tetratricopeptide repeat protein [Denitrobaculum tricleocarpae]